MYPLTGAMPIERPVPPTNPYSAPERAVLVGAAGEYVVRAGGEIKVGRDPAQCGVVLTEPRVSGVHASLKFEGVQLWAKDEQSNNGTFVDGARIAPGEWTPVRSGAQLRFGPIEMAVRVE
jgi:pSer/pThr/pTyr-binding forkhead associated (FHA) protein